MTAEEIIDEMKQEIPYRVPVELEPFIKIAMQMYAREAIKADRERVVENAKIKLTCFDGIGEIDPASILNLPIELPKTKCEHKNIDRQDGLDECLDCGARNY